MERIRTFIVLALVISIIAGAIVFLYRQSTPGQAIEIVPPLAREEIKVHVSGEVVNPGVYTLSAEARVEDAIKATGGFAADADRSMINLAQKLRDGDRVHVYKIGQVPQLININTADAWLVEALPGIGKERAKRIIESRTNEGPFLSIEDLVTRKVIPQYVFEKIKELITAY